MEIKVVLTQTDAKLGQRGQVVKVSPGFAYNFLIPQKKAVLVTPAVLKNLEAEKNKAAKETAELQSRREALAGKISQTTLTVEMLTGDGEKLYGAVTSQEIQTALSAQGIVLDKKEIHLEEPIKKLGVYTVPVKLHPQTEALLKVWVVKKK